MLLDSLLLTDAYMTWRRDIAPTRTQYQLGFEFDALHDTNGSGMLACSAQDGRVTFVLLSRVFFFVRDYRP